MGACSSEFLDMTFRREFFSIKGTDARSVQIASNVPRSVLQGWLVDALASFKEDAPKQRLAEHLKVTDANRSWIVPMLFHLNPNHLCFASDFEYAPRKEVQPSQQENEELFESYQAAIAFMPE